MADTDDITAEGVRVKRTSLSRRLLASAAGLAVGLGGALALTAPAHAIPHEGGASFLDNCDGGTYVFLWSEFGEPPFSVKVGGEDFWPDEGDDGTVAPGEPAVIFVPKDAGEIEVDYDYSYPADAWPKTHTWSEPAWCASLPAPTHEPATCEKAGEITIPALPLTDEGTDQATHVPEPDPTKVPLPAELLVYRLNGEVVEPESTHPAEPGTHEVTLSFEVEQHFAEATIELKLLLKSWTIEIEEPDCPDKTPHKDEVPDKDEAPDEKLADTGTPTLLIAAGALMLLTLGGVMYVMARRRRISFVS
jgi:hypothetical protein